MAAKPTSGSRSRPRPPSRSSPSHQGGLRFWLTAAVGWAVIIYGLRGMFAHHVDTKPTDIARFALGGALLHDLIFVPLVLVLGIAIARTVRGPARAVVQGAMIVSGSLALFAYPLVRGFASVLHNPSSAPHNYAVNLIVVIGVVWLVAGAAIVVRLRRPRDVSH